MRGIIGVERVPLWAGAGAAEHARGLGERTQVSRRGRPGTQTTVGPQPAGGSAGLDVAHAADRGVPNGARIRARLDAEYRVHERPFADDEFRSALDSVQRDADAAVLQATGRAFAGNSRSAERGPDAEYSTGNGRLRRRDLCAGGLHDASGPREFRFDDGYD